jgi:hypothetical protein
VAIVEEYHHITPCKSRGIGEGHEAPPGIQAKPEDQMGE